MDDLNTPSSHDIICIKELLEQYGQEPRCECPKCKKEKEDEE
jgi:hypothetical protein